MSMSQALAFVAGVALTGPATQLVPLDALEQPEPAVSDRVTRRDGTTIEGEIVELTAKERVVVETVDGSVVEIEWAEIEEIIRDGKTIARRSAKVDDEVSDAPHEPECVPDCRSGFVCVEGACVSACNPPCGPGDVCSATGECLAPAPAASSSTGRGLNGITRKRLRLQMEQGERQRKAGIGLMAGGTVTVLLGIFIGVAQFARRDNLVTDFSTCTSLATNLGMPLDQACIDTGLAIDKADNTGKAVIASFSVIGSLLVISGGAAFGVGTSNIKDAKARLWGGVSILPGGAGLSLSGRF